MAAPLSNPRTLLSLCLASAAWAFSFGLGAPLASLWLRDAGCSDTVIGANTGVYYLGIAVTACIVPWMMRRWSRGCPILGMVLSGLTVACFPWGETLAGWFALRILNGLAGAMSLIPLETFVNRHSPAEHRGRNFGFYAFAVALGWALGNLVGLLMYEDLPRLAFLLGGCGGLVAAAVVLGLMVWPEEPAAEHHAPTALGWRRNFLSFGSAWSQGFLEGGMVAFLPVYLLFLGMAEVRVSWLTSGIMVAVILFQVPVAWLADRLGAARVLLCCYAVAVTGLALLPFCDNSAWLALGLFLVGACSGAFYPLGLALLGERLPPAGLSRASAGFLAINCLGSLVGPVISGIVMDWLGKRAMFSVGEAAIVLVLAVWAGLQWTGSSRGGRSKPIREEISATRDAA